jgi:hypothetical protein
MRYIAPDGASVASQTPVAPEAMGNTRHAWIRQFLREAAVWAL